MNIPSAAIIGVVVILFGVSIIVKAFFKIDIPVFRTLFALFLIYLGVKILFGSFFFKTSSSDAIFGEATFKVTSERNEYNVIFGKGLVDLNDVSIESGRVDIEINAVFGSVDVIINDSIPIIVKSESVFSGVTFPNNTGTGFGTGMYQTSSYDPDKPYIRVKADAVFGSINFISR